MSKASEYAESQRARPVTGAPRLTFVRRVKMVAPVFGVNQDGNLACMTERDTEYVHADDIPALIKWLKETFED